MILVYMVFQVSQKSYSNIEYHKTFNYAEVFRSLAAVEVVRVRGPVYL